MPINSSFLYTGTLWGRITTWFTRHSTLSEIVGASLKKGRMKKAPSTNPFEDMSGFTPSSGSAASKTPVKSNVLPPPKPAGGSNVKKPPMNPFESGIDVPVKAAGIRAPVATTSLPKPITPVTVNAPINNVVLPSNSNTIGNTTQVSSFNGQTLNLSLIHI